MGMGLMLSACGGGGGGASSLSSGSQIEIMRPPVQVSALERRDSPQLDRVSGASVLNGEVSARGVEVAVLDTGVMAGHREFAGRVHAGGDWQDGGDGTTDPHGHGTHVASLMIASGDGRGMLGIAPEASVRSFRILNVDGVFGSRSGNQMVPAVLGDVARRKLPVVNNSWSSIYEIDDFGKASIARALSGELPAYRNLATADGPIMVWAAGNNGEREVSIRSGLPFHFPALQPNWLAVVATDLNGVETHYTNRCGVAADWCLTAPGGGDNEALEGLLGASISGDYTRKSGTSMAAPLVSGALAVVMSRFDGLTPRQAAQRLIATAELTGLRTLSGCTVATCGEAQMRAVFGHGMINLAAALSPIAPSAMISSRGDHTLNHSFLIAPHLTGDAIKEGLDGAVAVVRDDFDGMHFTVPVGSFVTLSSALNKHRVRHPPLVVSPSSGSSPTLYRQQDASLGASLGVSLGLHFIAAPSAPAEYHLPARLLDIPAAPTTTWAGYGVEHGSHWARLGFGNGDQRQVLHFMIADRDQPSSWAGMGADRSTTWLDGHGGGAFGIDTAASLWGFGGIQIPTRAGFLTAEALAGRTRIGGNGIMKAAEFDFDGGQVMLSSHAVAERGASLTVAMPPALSQGWIDLEGAVLKSAGQLDFVTTRHHLHLDQREWRVSVDYQGHHASGLHYHLSLSHRQNAGHIAGEEDNAITLSLRLPF